MTIKFKKLNSQVSCFKYSQVFINHITMKIIMLSKKKQTIKTILDPVPDPGLYLT